MNKDYFIVNQDDDEGHQVVLHIIQDLMKKAEDIFLEHFARLGMFGRVLDLAGPQESEAAAIKEEKVNHKIKLEQNTHRCRQLPMLITSWEDHSQNFIMHIIIINTLTCKR